MRLCSIGGIWSICAGKGALLPQQSLDIQLFWNFDAGPDMQMPKADQACQMQEYIVTELKTITKLETCEPVQISSLWEGWVPNR